MTPNQKRDLLIAGTIGLALTSVSWYLNHGWFNIVRDIVIGIPFYYSIIRSHTSPSELSNKIDELQHVLDNKLEKLARKIKKPRKLNAAIQELTALSTSIQGDIEQLRGEVLTFRPVRGARVVNDAPATVQLRRSPRLNRAG